MGTRRQWRGTQVANLVISWCICSDQYHHAKARIQPIHELAVTKMIVPSARRTQTHRTTKLYVALQRTHHGFFHGRGRAFGDDCFWFTTLAQHSSVDCLRRQARRHGDFIQLVGGTLLLRLHAAGREEPQSQPNYHDHTLCKSLHSFQLLNNKNESHMIRLGRKAPRPNTGCPRSTLRAAGAMSERDGYCMRASMRRAGKETT